MSTFLIMIITAVLSFMPVSELRGGIPFAIANNIPWYYAYPFSTAINILIAPFVWLFLASVHKLLYGTKPEKGIRWYKNFFDSFVEKARKRLSRGIEKWGWFGLALFIAIPLPFTGAWTGTVGAWVLGISKRRTMTAVIAGLIVAGALVTLVVMLGIGALNLFVKRM